MVNKITLIGHVGKDPAVFGEGDKQFVKFSLATSRSYKDKATDVWKSDTDWHTVVVFDKRFIQTVLEDVKAGTEVLVIGRMKYGEYTNKQGQLVNTADVQVSGLDHELRVLIKKKKLTNGSDLPKYSTSVSSHKPVTTEEYRDEIPF